MFVFFLVTGFLRHRVAGRWAFGGAFGPAGARPGGFGDTGGRAQGGLDVGKAPAAPAPGPGPCGVWALFPGQADRRTLSRVTGRPRSGPFWGEPGRLLVRGRASSSWAAAAMTRRTHRSACP